MTMHSIFGDEQFIRVLRESKVVVISVALTAVFVRNRLALARIDCLMSQTRHGTALGGPASQ